MRIVMFSQKVSTGLLIFVLSAMNEVTTFESWGWSRPDVETYVLLVRGLAACLRVADALRIIGLISGAGIASGDEVIPFFF